MFMKGTRLILLILSILLLTISSGLLFYKNLFLLESPSSGGKVDFEELRYTDLQINATTAMLRKNLSADLTVLDGEIVRIKELMNIVTDVNKNTIELADSIKKIQAYFDHKIKGLNDFKVALAELKTSVSAINQSYNELNKQNIKFTVDKKDFYRECVVDALYYVTVTNKDNETRLFEDQKILGQILSFATAPNPHIQKFSRHVETIHRRTNEIENLTDSFNNENSIRKEMTIVGQYYREAQNSRARDGEVFLTMVFGAIVLYLISVVVILKKLT
jgi:uncharacterized protein YoxC